MELGLLEGIRRTAPKDIFLTTKQGPSQKTINWRDALRLARERYPNTPNSPAIVRLFEVRHLLTHYQVAEAAGVVDLILDDGLGWLAAFLIELGEDLAQWAGGREALQVLVGIDPARPHVRKVVEADADWLRYRDKGTELVLIHCPGCFQETLTVSEELPVPQGTCVSCGHVTSLAECDRCGNTFASEELSSADPKEAQLCEYCLDYIARD